MAYTSYSQETVDKERGAELRFQVPRRHVSKKYLLIDELGERVIPCEV